MNNTIILKKCLAELSKTDVRLDYLRGMLETLVEMQPVAPYPIVEMQPVAPYPITVPHPMIAGVRTPVSPVTPAQDEGALLDAKARASIETIKALADKSVES